ncbi:response regulator [Leeia aquatica]|uniref:Response regulator n=1 Tax=Leeia aquatica TaxID=2725557 RepID=A0A847S6P6_9NEIS|nr:response regulator [Leeia aquatica]NLR75433.1 response regulator [Leeia aquatica]
MTELQRIMYVEDEPDIQTVARLALEMIGKFTVLVCSSGQEALDKVTDFAPNMVLLDVMMPNMDGPTTLSHLRGLSVMAGVPVVFMTAKAQPSEVQQFRDLGAVDVIPKPFDPMQLPSQLRSIWTRCQQESKPHG